MPRLQPRPFPRGRPPHRSPAAQRCDDSAGSRPSYPRGQRHRYRVPGPHSRLYAGSSMIPVPSGVKVWMATGHTDMRKGFPGLSLMVQETLKRDPMCGHLFVFRGRGGGLIKVIWHDGQGACLFTKKLERGRFIWPSAADGTVVITPAQLGYLLEGIDWRLAQKNSG